MSQVQRALSNMFLNCVAIYSFSWTKAHNVRGNRYGKWVKNQILMSNELIERVKPFLLCPCKALFVNYHQFFF